MRTNQRLINYNTSGATNVPVHSDLQHGEIAVRYNEENPALFIKDNNNNIVTFIASGAISTAIENAQGNVNQLSSATYNFIETDAPNTYLTIASAESTYYTSGDVNTQISGVQDTLQDEIDDINETIEKIDVGAVSAITSEKIEHWDSAYTQGHVHANMGVLTALTAEEVAKWNASAHNHSNKDVLDGITSDKVTAWDNAVDNAITGVTVNNESATISNHVAQITINEASAIEKGLMSSTDKAKLDTIADSAQTNVIETVKVDGTALTVTDKAVDITLSVYPDKAEWNGENKTIEFKHGDEVLSGMTISGATFIKDGMVENVFISGGNLVVTFNTDAGHEDIEIPITDIFDANNYYTKTEADTQIANASARSVNSAVTYVNSVSGQIESTVNLKADKSEVTALSGNVVTELDKKVDKQTGYSLIADSEITRLVNMSNSIATSAASGYMSSEMVTKLNGIEANAQVNQKALAIVTGNTGTYTATAETDTFSIVSNKTDLVSTNVDGSVVTIDVKFSAATQDAAGLMTSADKTKLDGMADGTAIQAISALTYANSANIHTLSGKVVSDYATSGNVVAALNTKADKNTFEAVSGVVENNKTNITTLSGSVVSDYYTKTVVDGYLSAKTDINTFKTVSGVVETNSGNIYTLSGEVVTNETNISELSASTQTIETKANSAIQGYGLGTVETSAPNCTTQSGARATYTSGGTATLDLTNLVIDCGTF